MSFQSWFWLLVGLFVIYRVYKKALDNNSINTIIKIRDVDDAPKFVSESTELKLAKIQKALFKRIAIVSSVLYLLLVTNLVFNYLKAWYFLGFCGLVLSYYYFQLESMPTFRYLRSREIPTNHEFQIAEEVERDKKFMNARNNSLAVVIVTLIVSGNWAYQVQKNQSEAKLWAMSEMSDLVGEGWCQNFWDIKATPGPDGDYDVSKTGGWPCITIGSVSNIRFKDLGKNLEMCLDYSLSRSVGLPSDSYDSSKYKYESTCSTDDIWKWTEGWDKDSIQDKIRSQQNIFQELEELQVAMCRNYYFNLSFEERNAYCYGLF